MAGWLAMSALVACASAPRREVPPAAPPPPAAEVADAAPPEPAAAEPATEPEHAAPSPTIGSYDEALSTPEALDVHDDRAHLTDTQLREPMRNVMAACRIPRNAKVTVKTAIQNGRAIGVTVLVRFDRPPPPPKPKTTAKPRKGAKPKGTKPKKPPPETEAQADAKASVKVVACVEKAVRGTTWPPSSRRDSLVTEF